MKLTTDQEQAALKACEVKHLEPHISPQVAHQLGIIAATEWMQGEIAKLWEVIEAGKAWMFVLEATTPEEILRAHPPLRDAYYKARRKAGLDQREAKGDGDGT